MANMSYCRFENTAHDLDDCAEYIDEKLSVREAKMRKALIKTCFEICEQFIDFDKQELDESEIDCLPIEK